MCHVIRQRVVKTGCIVENGDAAAGRGCSPTAECETDQNGKSEFADESDCSKDITLNVV